MKPEGLLPHHKSPPPVPILIQTSPGPYPTSCRSILILSSHLRLGLQIGFFPTGFPTKSLYTPLLSTNRATCPGNSHSSSCDHPKNIWLAAQIIKFLTMRFSPLPCYLVPLTPKYLPQHPILQHPKPIFLPQCKRPSFTSAQSNRQNYSFSILIDHKIYSTSITCWWIGRNLNLDNSVESSIYYRCHMLQHIQAAFSWHAVCYCSVHTWK